MITTFVITQPSEKGENAASLRLKLFRNMEINRHPILCRINLRPERIRKSFYKFYKVNRNETAITEVLTNDFEPFQTTWLKIKTALGLHSKKNPAFSIPADGFMFYGFLSQVKAMEFAKAGALKYISRLIDEGEKSYDLLVSYREAHYEDLNINLTENNIRSLELTLESV